MARGFVIAAPRSGSGKTLVTLGIIAALRARGLDVAPAKAGPDYIDTAILSRVAGRDAVNLDAWAMRPERLRALADVHADLLVVEGVMGLFDGAADGTGSTGDLAEILGLPVVLVVDCERMSQSVAPLVAGFTEWRPGLRTAGVILNRVASQTHEEMLLRAIEPLGIPVLGTIPRRETLALPSRHLGLVLPGEAANFDAVVLAAQGTIESYLDLDSLLSALPSRLRRGVGGGGSTRRAVEPAPTLDPSPQGGGRRLLLPLGQKIAIARDDAFAFIYPHWLSDWRAAGAEISFFSPLADEAPDESADAVFLPGGYPELHGAQLAAASRFKAGLVAARERGALIYGECGGFMVLGQTLTDKDGVTHEMTGMLRLDTMMTTKPMLGYRRLSHESPLPWPRALSGHEFHYSTMRLTGQPVLFESADALGNKRAPMGVIQGRVMGSYAHVIDVAG